MMDETDTLICLGDVCFGDKEKNVPWFLSQLRVKKFINVFGNHDRREVILKHMDPTASDYREMSYKGLKLVLCHYPIHSWNEMKRSLHFFGHVHSNPRMEHGRSMDVGVDGNNMKPYLLDDAIDYLRSKEIFTEGHH